MLSLCMSCQALTEELQCCLRCCLHVCSLRPRCSPHALSHVMPSFTPWLFVSCQHLGSFSCETAHTHFLALKSSPPPPPPRAPSPSCRGRRCHDISSCTMQAPQQLYPLLTVRQWSESCCGRSTTCSTGGQRSTWMAAICLPGSMSIACNGP